MYLFLVSVQCTSTLLLQLIQTPTDSSYKRKKTDQERKNNGTNLTAIQRNLGPTVAVTMSIFFPSNSLRASRHHYNAIFLI